MDTPIVFFDSHCLLCNASVQFILKNEAIHILKFAPINGKAWLQFSGKSTLISPPESILVADNNTILEYSQAVLLILKNMGGLWKLLSYFASIFPRFILDFFYKIIAKHRYSWFGTTDSCTMPTPELRSRFLE